MSRQPLQDHLPSPSSKDDGAPRLARATLVACVIVALAAIALVILMV
jgi:hypothetical protein